MLIEARRSVQCVVRGFLETSAHKSHRYISRYPEIFEKKSRLIVRKIRYTGEMQTILCAKQKVNQTFNKSQLSQIFNKMFLTSIPYNTNTSQALAATGREWELHLREQERRHRSGTVKAVPCKSLEMFRCFVCRRIFMTSTRFRRLASTTRTRTGISPLFISTTL